MRFGKPGMKRNESGFYPETDKNQDEKRHIRAGRENIRGHETIVRFPQPVKRDKKHANVHLYQVMMPVFKMSVFHQNREKKMKHYLMLSENISRNITTISIENKAICTKSNVSKTKGVLLPL
jgi:predicted cupin superfamily sugar epimerase